jgi:excinuclease ABC subunit A
MGESQDTSRIADSVETALRLGDGVVLVSIADGEELLFSEHFACVHCGFSLGEIAPRTFSFNSPHGACPACSGLGVKLEIDPNLVIPDRNLSISEGAIHPWGWFSWHATQLEDIARHYGFSLHTPVKDLSEQHLKAILYGEQGELVKYRGRYGRIREHFTGYEGIIPYLERMYRETDSDHTRADIERYMSSHPCPVCQGKRLKPEALAVTIGGKNIIEVCSMSIEQALDWIRLITGEGMGKPVLSPREMTIARQILKEIRARLSFLINVGLDYLTLERPARTLSGGETQRIRLATQIGSGLTGVLYICDEPTVGLHLADNFRLIETLKKLRDLGNTILIVEHDEAMMRAADYIIDMGPGAGEHGGEIVAAGTINDIMTCSQSLTGQYLNGAKKIPLPQKRRPGLPICHSEQREELIIKGARENNLKNITVHIPLGMFVCITGVSGSGKSTLVNEVLYKRLEQIFYRAKDRPGECDDILGLEHIDKVVSIDQSPIGRTPRSNPATYTGTFTPIRELFATVPEARMRGYAPGRFSFNVKGGAL